MFFLLSLFAPTSSFQLTPPLLRQASTTTLSLRLNKWIKLEIPPSTSSDSGSGSGKASPVEVHQIRSRKVFVKRDDTLNLETSHVSGNKARKLFSLNSMPLSNNETIVSYGGPQSNAMVALAAITNSKKNCNFVYYTKVIPRFLKQNPAGNFLRAKSLGMQIIELKPDTYNELFKSMDGGTSDPPPNLAPPSEQSVWVPQGGACTLAKLGCEILADELFDFWSSEVKGQQMQGQGQGQQMPLAILIPCGTGTTAFYVNWFLQKRLRKEGLGNREIEVFCVPCVGDMGYLQRQQVALSKNSGLELGELELGEDEIPFPTVLKPRDKKGGGKIKYLNFGKPEFHIMRVYEELLEEHGLFVDLLYGAPAWHTLLGYFDSFELEQDSFEQEKENPPKEKENPLNGKFLLYYHSGGLEGVSSQMKRYEHLGMVAKKDVQ